MKFFQLFAMAVATTEALRLRVKGDEEHEMVQGIIDELDADNSGTIELNELLSYAKEKLEEACKEHNVSKTECNGYWEQGKKWLTKMFNDADSDNNGSVDRKELDTALKSAGV